MRLPFAVALLLAAAVAQAQKLGPVDWIFLVDTSKSMRGVGERSKDIFGDVKASIDTFVREANDGDSVTIYTFDSDVRLHSAMPIDIKSRADLTSIVDSLEAEGNRTHLGAAIAKGLERAASLPKDATRSRAVVLFTDGREDVKGIKNPTPIDASLGRAGDAFIYFVSMGEHEPKLDAFAGKTPHTTVLKAPTAEAIREIVTKIRATIPPPPEPPPPPPITRPEPPSEPEPEPTPSLLAQVLKIAIPLTLLAAIAFAVFLNHRKQNRLEGELEILHPATADGLIGLPKLQASEVALSAILPIDLGGSDARMFVRRRAGKKKVCISARDGSLRVNDVATPETELYDADTIQIGDAKLRFNRVGDERQEEFS
jgi:von Willebrand factor type A domain